jgi:hypothetical protein
LVEICRTRHRSAERPAHDLGQHTISLAVEVDPVALEHVGAHVAVGGEEGRRGIDEVEPPVRGASVR